VPTRFGRYYRLRHFAHLAYGAHIGPMNFYAIRKGLLRPAMLQAKAPDIYSSIFRPLSGFPAGDLSGPMRFTPLKSFCAW
jgi:hypothetical protein